MQRSPLTGFAILLVALTIVPAPARAIGGEGEAWPSFTESSSCGAQRIPTPHAAETGWLPKSTLLRGEFAAMFGRSTDQIHRELVSWRMPGSSEILAVHPRVVPALDQAAEQIERSIVQGNRYRIDGPSTFSTASRTISGSLRISRHTYGTAFDVNSRRNPFSESNQLITDLPEWWIQSFLDAGFCWGGLWIGSKDAMHFAWQGPAFSSMEQLPSPYEPLTDPLPFIYPDVSVSVVPRSDRFTVATVLADADGNGAIDVIRVVDHGSDLLIDASLAARRHNACSSRVSVVSGIGGRARRAHTIGFGDIDGRGGQDLWIATDADGVLRLTVRWAFGGYAAETSTATDIPTPSPSAFISTADHDADGRVDVFIVDGTAINVWAIDPSTGVTSHLLSQSNPLPNADEYFLGDIDLDVRPDLWAIRNGEVSVSLAADDYATVASRHRPVALPGSLEDVRAADYDGDGRLDLITFDGITKHVWLGNTRLADGLPLEVWFEYADPGCEDGEPTWDRQELRFATSTWVSNGSFAWRSSAGLQVDCDPSEDDCPVQPVTRQSFSEFLAWVDGLDPAEGNTATAAAWALVDAGYAIVCQTYDTACWNGLMSRSELADAFGQFLAQRRGDVPAPHRWLSSADLIHNDEMFPR